MSWWRGRRGALRDCIEIRGLGIVRIRRRTQAALALVVDLVDGDSIERHPEDVADVALLGVRLPLLRLDPRSASAPARVRAGLAVLGAAFAARPANRASFPFLPTNCGQTAE